MNQLTHKVLVLEFFCALASVPNSYVNTMLRRTRLRQRKRSCWRCRCPDGRLGTR
jgi:hypothetical protein